MDMKLTLTLVALLLTGCESISVELQIKDMNTCKEAGYDSRTMIWANGSIAEIQCIYTKDEKDEYNN